MDLNQSKEERFTDEEMSEVDRLQSDPSSEYYYNDPDNEEGFLDKIKRKLEPYGEDFKGFIEYLFTPSRHFGTGQYSEGGLEAQMSTSGLDAEGRRRRTDSSGKYKQRVEEGQEDIAKAASFIVPFYDSGVNIANVAQEYMKPEQERDYDYIKSQFTEAGQSAAIEGGLLLMGGVAGKYGAKGIKALADKVKQYEIDPTAMSAFGAGAIRIKPKKTKPFKLEDMYRVDFDWGRLNLTDSQVAELANVEKSVLAAGGGQKAVEAAEKRVQDAIDARIPVIAEALKYKLKTSDKGVVSLDAYKDAVEATVRFDTIEEAAESISNQRGILNKMGPGMMDNMLFDDRSMTAFEQLPDTETFQYIFENGLDRALVDWAVKEEAIRKSYNKYTKAANKIEAPGAEAIRKKPTIKESVPTIEATGLTDEAIETWRKKNKTSDEFRKALKGRNPELQELAKGVSEGRVFSTTYRKRADELRPIRVVKEVPKPATNKEIVSALNDKQRRNPIIGLNEKVSTGEMVDVRLNIPAYTDYNVWVPTIRHDGKEKYKAAVRLKNVNFIKPTLSGSAKRTDSSKALKVAEGGEKNPFAVMTGEYVEGTDDELFTMSKEVFDSSEWTQVGYDPIKRGFFYDRETGQAILEADEVIQVGHLVLAKNAKKTDPDVFPFNKGGAVMDDQMKMAFMDEGGIADDGMDVDPVSGNEVPPGSLAEEVRDDIPAQLSEGEYVVPADVVRYYGVKFFEDLRDQAKMGLAEMEANGRIGGEPVPAGGPKNENLTPEEQQAVEAMMGMEQGGAVQNPYLQQQQLYNQEPPKATGNTMGYAEGGSSAPVNQLQAQAITPTVYNQPNYSFLSPSTTTQTSQTTEQAINQATQNVFTPVMMRSPEGVEAEAKTRAQMKEWLAAGWTILTGAQTTTTTTEETTTTPTDTTITPTTPTRTGGGGTNITVGDKSGTGGFGFGFKNWGKDVDWSDPDSIKTFVENSTQGLLDPKTGKKITEVGFGIAGPVGGALGAAASTVPSLSSLSDLRASRFMLQAQGMETDFVDAQIKKITDNASGFTNFIDKVFGEVADGDAKGRANLDRLGFEYTRDEKTGDPTFTPEQIAANRAKAKRPATGSDADPGPTAPSVATGPGVRSGVKTGLSGGRGTIIEKPGDRQEAARQETARKAAKKRRDKRNTAVKKAKSISKSVKGKGAKPVDSRKKSGAFDKGGLMNKKGNK